jgi:hypothetical protein
MPAVEGESALENRFREDDFVMLETRIWYQQEPSHDKVEAAEYSDKQRLKFHHRQFPV